MTRWLVELRRQEQHYSPDGSWSCADRSSTTRQTAILILPNAFTSRVVREIGFLKADLRQYLWHFGQEIERFTVGLFRVNP